MTRWLNRMQPWGIFLLRIVLGLSMVVHGYPKVIPAGGLHTSSIGSALDHYARYVASLGLPEWLGYVSAFAEFVGGLCMIVGLFTRFFAFLIAVNMLVAILFVALRLGYSRSEYPLALAAMAFLLLLTGPGKANLDRRIGLT